MNALAVERGYRHCAGVTRASATSFYYGMRLLPRERRAALYAVYAFARRVDDIADGDLSLDDKLSELDAARASLARLGVDDDDPVLVALADACRRYPIRLSALHALIDGAVVDLAGGRYATFDELLPYCRQVGGSIGRLSVGVFGASDLERAEALADDLGVALQLTNILRDVGEDLDRGRVYLPAEELEAFGCRLGAHGAEGPFAELVGFQVARAEEWYAAGLRLLPLLDRPCAASVAAMAGVYRRLLRRIAREPESVLARRLTLPTWEKGWIAARSLVGSAP